MDSLTKSNKIISFLLVCTIFFALPGSPAEAYSAFPLDAKIDPYVLEDTAGGFIAPFLVLLESQAEVQLAAVHASNSLAQGRLVYQALRQAAASAQPKVIAQLDALGLAYRPYWIANLIAVEGNRASVVTLAAMPEVKRIESNRIFRAQLEHEPGILSPAPNGIEWNVARVDAPALWQLGYTGQGTVYANADTGVQWDHPALKAQYRGWDGTSVDHNYHWWDAIHADLSGNGANPCSFTTTTPCDDYGHGTHTLGTGVGDDGGGNRIGVAPGARWIACRNMEEGYGRPETYLECLQFFLAPTDLNGENPDPDRRPDAISNSYSCPPFEACAPHVMQTALEHLRAAGIFVAASAGNSGRLGCATIDAPPALEEAVITVGATGFMNDTIANFSSRGPVAVDSSNRRKPDLVAPGVSVRSSHLNNGYVLLQGTSMAAPHVAGAVNLLWSAFPELRRDVDYTQFILEKSAVQLTSSEGCGGDLDDSVPNHVYGYGRLDVQAAYRHLTGPWWDYYFPFLPFLTNTAPIE